MATEVSVLLVGIGGYGAGYTDILLHGEHPVPTRIAGVADPFASRSPLLPELEALGVPIVDKPEEFYASNEADLAVISSPIQFHCAQTVTATRNGSNVLCEKPLGAVVQEAYEMIKARDAAGNWVGIGYQWSYSDEIQALKQDIRAGLFGEPKALKCLVLWPRDEKYYKRSGWAGRIRDDKDRWILDSPVNNACAHYLHNMLYVLGEKTDLSARPVDVTAELYRANEIENYDTAALRAHTDTGVEILFVVSHAVEEKAGPVFRFEFEKGTVEYDADAGAEVIARLQNGTIKTYPSPDGLPRKKLWDAVRAVTRPVCGLEAAMMQTICMNGAQESAPAIVDFPKELVWVTGEPGARRTWVESLFDTLKHCYEESALPCELGIEWAKQGGIVDLRDYKNFPSAKLDKA